MSATKNKRVARVHRMAKTRAKINALKSPRLSIHRTLRHIYAQVILPEGKVVAHASTLDGEVLQSGLTHGGNVSAAKIVGKFVAIRAKGVGIEVVAFDRSGFKYHGRVKALADAAREYGLVF